MPDQQGTTKTGKGVSKPGEVVERDKIRLPVWAWALIGGVGLVVGWRFYQAYKAQQAQNASGTNVPGATTAADQNTPSTTIIGPSDIDLGPLRYQASQINQGIQQLNGTVTNIDQYGGAATNLYSGQPGYFWKSGDDHLYPAVSDDKGNTYSVDPLAVDGNYVNEETFEKAIKKLPSYWNFTKGDGDYAAGYAFTPEMGQEGARFLASHSVDAQGNIVNSPPNTPTPGPSYPPGRA